MGKDDNELEFVSINQDDEDDGNMTQSYANAPASGDAGSSSGGGDSVIGRSFLKQSKHPAAAFFHILFKILALLIYMFGSWFTSNFIFNFVICILLLAFDFWTVKNVTGRLLVGLRWWSYVREDGSNEWIFETLEDMAEISAFDSRLFWGALYASPVMWGLMLVIGVLRLKFEYLPVVLAALSMNTANIVGYYKCSSSAKTKMQSLVNQGLKQSSLAALENSSFRNMIFGALLNASSGGVGGKRNEEV
jgi:hypothetical protein